MASQADSVIDTDKNVELIEVEVVYAEPRRHELIQLRLPLGSTLRQAVEASGLIQKFPEIDLVKSKLGIYGKIARANTVLCAEDRIEVYRPSIADPKEIRKRRAAARVRLGKLLKSQR